VIKVVIPAGKYCLAEDNSCCPFLQDDEALTMCNLFDEELIPEEDGGHDMGPDKCMECIKLKKPCTIQLVEVK